MKKIILETANGSVILEGADASEYLDTKLGNMLPPDLMKGFEASLAVAATKKKAVNARTQPANLHISFATTLDAKSFMKPANESVETIDDLRAALDEAAGKKEKDVKDMTELEFLEYWTGIKPGKVDNNKKFTSGNELLYSIVMDVKAWVTEMLKGKFLTMAFPGKDLNTMQFISYLRSIFIDICYFQAGQMSSYDYYYVTIFSLQRRTQKRIQKLCKQYKFFESLMKLMTNCICIAINNKYSKYFKDQSVMYELGSYLIFMDVPEGYSIL